MKDSSKNIHGESFQAYRRQRTFTEFWRVWGTTIIWAASIVGTCAMGIYRLDQKINELDRRLYRIETMIEVGFGLKPKSQLTTLEVVEKKPTNDAAVAK